MCICCSNKINANTNKDKRKQKLIEWHKNNQHPLKGTKRPPHVIDALKKANTGRELSKEHKKKLSIRNSGDGNPMYGKKHTKDNIKKMCTIQQKIARRGEECNFYGKCYHGKGGWYTNDETKIWMRSTWELKFAKYLDLNNIQWTFEKNIFPIIYNDKKGTYRPDFYLIDLDLYVEIKGWWRDDAKIKYTAFKEQYKNIQIEIYDSKKLKELKII